MNKDLYINLLEKQVENYEKLQDQILELHNGGSIDEMDFFAAKAIHKMFKLVGLEPWSSIASKFSEADLND